MRVLEEVFLESDFESSALARQRRDERLVELQGKGYECRAENLYTIHTGMRIFLVVAIPPAEAADLPLRAEKRKTILSPAVEVERARTQVTPKARVKDRGVRQKADLKSKD